MSEDPVPQESSEVDETEASAEHLPVRDWFGEPDVVLAFLVAMANAVEVEVSIRLTISGGVVSGDLVGMGAFFDRSAEQVLKDVPDEETGTLLHAIADVFTGNAENSREANAEADSWDTDIRHIHLDRAVLHVPGAEPLPIGLWRGKLTSVTGWSMGKYGSPHEQSQ